MFGNRRHFRVLQERSEEGIASNILADRLRRLVAAGLLHVSRTRADPDPDWLWRDSRPDSPKKA